MRIATVQTDVFNFSELSADAQQRAIDTAREWSAQDDFFAEYVTEDAKTIAALMGIEIDNIYYSGFWSQGDGAQFTGNYSYQKHGAKSVREYAPQDSELQLIANGLQDVQRRNFYALSASVESRGHYSHAYCTAIDCYDSRSYYADADTAETVAELLRDFMNWIYARLQSEYEYQTSEENAREYLENSEFEFTAEGAIYG